MDEDKTKEAALNEVLENSKERVKIGRHSLRVGWVRNAAKRKVSSILESETDESKVVSKCVAALILNRRLLMWPFWWFLWRWIYYVEEFTEEEMLAFISVCKKKADAMSYFVIMACLNDMRDTMEKMTRTDAKRILQRQK